MQSSAYITKPRDDNNEQRRPNQSGERYVQLNPVLKRARSKNKESDLRSTAQLHISWLQARPVAATSNKASNNGHPIWKSSEYSPAKSYALYPSAISITRYVKARSAKSTITKKPSAHVRVGKSPSLFYRYSSILAVIKVSNFPTF